MTKTDLANLAISKIGESLIEDIEDDGDRVARLAALHYPQVLKEILRAHFWGFAMTAAEMPRVNLGVIVSGCTFEEAANGAYAKIDGDPWPTYQFGIYTLTRNPVGIFPGGSTWRLEFVDGLTVLIAYSTEDVATPDLVESWLGYSEITVVPDDSSLVGWSAAFTLPADFLKLRRVVDPVTLDPVERFDLRRANANRCLVSGDFDSLSLEYVALVDDPDAYDPLFVAAFTTLLASRLARAVSGSEAMEGQLRQLYETVDLPAARTADGHDTQSAENHPFREFLDGNLLGRRSDFFPELD